MAIRCLLNWTLSAIAALVLLAATGAKADDAPALLKSPFNAAQASGRKAEWARRHLGRQAVERIRWAES